MFNLFKIPANWNNKKKQQAEKLDDETDFVKFGGDDDEWEEISSNRRGKSTIVESAPVIVPEDMVEVTPTRVTVQENTVQENKPQEVLQISVPAQEPAWKIELEKRDKTPYMIASAGNDHYATIDTGLPYAQAVSSQQSYVVPQDHHEPYALAGVSTVAYVATYTVPKDAVEKNDIPYCVAY